MKKLIFVFFAGVSLMSCSKKDVTLPGAANQNVFFKNSNVEVKNLKTSQTSNTVIVSFSTLYENNVKRIELMSSGNENTFCTVEGEDVGGSSQTVKGYSFQDEHLKAKKMYYILRFRDNAGNWTYSNYYTINIK